MAFSFAPEKNPCNSTQARELNRQVFKRIKDEAVKESNMMGFDRGEDSDMQGTGRRNAHLLAIDSYANSSIIVSTSPSIEPSKANALHTELVSVHIW